MNNVILFLVKKNNAQICIISYKDMMYPYTSEMNKNISKLLTMTMNNDELEKEN